MSKAFKCDNCGKVFSGYPYNEYSTTLKEVRYHIELTMPSVVFGVENNRDLCLNCFYDIVLIMVKRCFAEEIK